jgi:hypothetical protein
MTAPQISAALDIVSCVICMNNPRDARLCPQCACITCNVCVREWYTSNPVSSQICPNCRVRIHLSSFVRIPWLEELTGTLHPLLPTPIMCHLHFLKPATLFCQACQQNICTSCALWGQHSEHDCKSLSKVTSSEKDIENKSNHSQLEQGEQPEVMDL